MKRILTLSAIVLSLATVFSCNNNKEEPTPSASRITGEYAINVDTPLEIAPGERLSVFYGKSGSGDYGSNDAYKMPQVGSKAEGELSVPLEEDVKYDWYVIYPYAPAIQTPEDIPFDLGAQTQDGPDSDAHLLHLLAGARKSVTASTMSPRVTLTEVTSTLAIKVYNTSTGVFDISSIQVESDADIAAKGSVDLTSGAPVFKPSGSGKVLSLRVRNASLERNSFATFFLSVAPCEAQRLKITIGDVEVETDCSAFVSGQTQQVDFSTAEIPHFREGITSYIDAADYWHATLAAPYTLSGEFDLKDLFTKLPAGEISFELGTLAKQNALVQEQYEALSGCLVNGHWNPGFAFGTAFNVEDADKCGILFVMKQNNKPLFNIYLSSVDPLASKVYMIGDKSYISVPEIFDDNYTGWGVGGNQFSAAEAEYWQTITNWETTMLQPGAQEVVHLAELFSDYSPVADPANPEAASPTTYIRMIYNLDTDWRAMLKWIGGFADFSLKGSDGQEIVFYNGKDLELTDYGKALTRHSNGLYWIPAWTVMYSSARWNLPSDERGAETRNKAQADGTYWGNLDGNPIPGVPEYYEGDAERLRQERGIYVENGILKTDETYTGIGFRMAPRLCFEYDYGTAIYFLGPRYIAHVYFNRYFAPATANDK